MLQFSFQVIKIQLYVLLSFFLKIHNLNETDEIDLVFKIGQNNHIPSYHTDVNPGSSINKYSVKFPIELAGFTRG